MNDHAHLYYRQVLNLKNMGDYRLTFEKDGCTNDVSTPSSPLTIAMDITGGRLRVRGSKPANAYNSFTLDFPTPYVSGTFTRDLDGRLCQLSHVDMTTQVRDDRSSPWTAADDRHHTCSPGLFGPGGRAEGLDASPVFTPTEQRNMKVLIRPTQCLPRAQWDLDWNCPGCHDPTRNTRFIFDQLHQCNAANPTCTLPADDPRVKDCPNWLTVAAGDNCCSSPSAGVDTFAVGRDLECEPGSCFFIEYVVELEDSAGHRTAFGRPPNAADGMSQGTFFVYDPDITYTGRPDNGDDNNTLIIVVVTVVAVAVLGAAGFVYHRKKKAARSTGPQGSSKILPEVAPPQL